MASMMSKSRESLQGQCISITTSFCISVTLTSTGPSLDKTQWCCSVSGSSTLQAFRFLLVFCAPQLSDVPSDTSGCFRLSLASASVNCLHDSSSSTLLSSSFRFFRFGSLTLLIEGTSDRRMMNFSLSFSRRLLSDNIWLALASSPPVW
ncbi:hypothetical protein DsansV1_C22g0172401 [Dioscorea sansibarensis]